LNDVKIIEATNLAFMAWCATPMESMGSRTPQVRIFGTLQQASDRRIWPRQSQDRSNRHAYFKARGDSIVTAPMLANMNDFSTVLNGS